MFCAKILRSTGVVGVLWALSFVAFARAEHPLLVTNDANKAWHTSADSNEVVWLGTDPSRPPVLVLNKSKVIPGEMVIESDSEKAILKGSSSLSLELKMNAGEKLALSFETLASRPTLKVNGEESAARRGVWIALASDESSDLTVELPGATFATVVLNPAGTNKEDSTPAREALRPAAGREQGVKAASDPGTAEAGQPGKLPALNLRQTGTAQEVIAAATALSTSIGRTCPKCNGSGLMTEKRQTGTRTEGIFVRKIYTDVEVTCDRCAGKKIVRARDDAIAKIAGRLSQTVSMLSPEAKDQVKALNTVFDVVTNRVIADRSTWSLMTNNARSIMAQRSIEPRTPVMLQVIFDRLETDGAKNRTYVGHIKGIEQVVYLTRPATVEDIHPGTRTLVGGMVAGTQDTADGHRAVVVEGGYMLAPAVQKEWFWWFD